MAKEKKEVIQISKESLWKFSSIVMLAAIIIGGAFALKNKGERGTGNGIFMGDNVEVKTTIKNFQYSPDTITVKRGSKVRLTITNKDNVNHGLHLPRFGVVSSVPASSTKTFEFTAIENPSNGQAIPTCTQEHGETLTFNVV